MKSLLESFVTGLGNQLGLVCAGLLIAALGVILGNVIPATQRRKSNIKKDYLQGRSIGSMESKMQNSRLIRVLALSARGFTHTYRSILTSHVANGGRLEFLLAEPNSALMQEASEMEQRGPGAITQSLHATIELIGAIWSDAKRVAEREGKSTGTIEARFYHTEIRNPIIMCIGNDNKLYAWISVLIPPKAAAECQMLEYFNGSDCAEYFNLVWRRYESTAHHWRE